MITFYMMILCLSTAIAAWAGLRACKRLMPVLHLPPAAGWCTLAPVLGFLMVVGAPAPMLVGAWVLALSILWLRDRATAIAPRLLMAGIACLFGISALHTTPAAYLAVLPLAALYVLAFASWLAVTFLGSYSPSDTKNFSFGLLAASLLLVAAPLQQPAAVHVAYDAAILGSGLMGVLLVRGSGPLLMHRAARMGMGFVLAFLQLDALWRGAWLPAAASSALWLLVLGWGWVRDEQRFLVVKV